MNKIRILNLCSGMLAVFSAAADDVQFAFCMRWNSTFSVIFIIIIIIFIITSAT